MEKMGEYHPFLTHVEELALMWQEFRLGSFRQQLMDTISKASMVNRAKLSRVYADEVEAVRRYENEEGFWEGVQDKVKTERRGYDQDGDAGEEAEV